MVAPGGAGRGHASGTGRLRRGRRRWGCLGGHGRRRAGRAPAGHPPAEVGDAGAVRGLLRRARPGLLRGRGHRPHDQARRPRHRPRAGRARRAGRVRAQLARQHARDTRPGRRDRQHRAGVRPLGHDRGDVGRLRPRRHHRARGQEGRRVARRQRAQALRRPHEERDRSRLRRRDRRAAVRHEPLPQPGGRRGRGDDVQRARPGAGAGEPGHGRALHARRPERLPHVRPGHGRARGRRLRARRTGSRTRRTRTSPPAS